MIDEVRPISKDSAVELINRFHYSKVLPRINKHFIGGFCKGELVAVCTLGYGVRPLHTIKKIFPTLDVKDYFEIGKLCVDDKMERNTESNFISQVIAYIKTNIPNVKLLYSWSDGIIGKPGYVYQASNFFYGGFILTEMYLNDEGFRIHPRSVQGLSTVKSTGKFNSRSFETTQAMGLKKYFGYQFRYCYPLCNKREWHKLLPQSTVSWERKGFPKDADCKWFMQTSKGKREECPKPSFILTKYMKETYHKKESFSSGDLFD